MLREWCDCACIGGRHVDRSRRSPNVPPMYLAWRRAGRRRTLSRPKCGRRRRAVGRSGVGMEYLKKLFVGTPSGFVGSEWRWRRRTCQSLFGVRKFSSLSPSLPLDSRLSFLRAIAGNELVGKSAVTLVTSGLRLRSGDLNGLLTHTIRAHNRHSPEI